MNATKSSSNPVSRIKVLLYVCAAFLVISAAVVYFAITEKARIQSQMDADFALIVYDEVSSTIMLLPLILLIVTLALLIEVYAADIRNRSKTKKEEKAQKYLTYFLVASVPAILVVGSAIDSSWHERLNNAGYSQCQNNILMLSKRFANSAWVRDPAMCYDEEARLILIKSHSDRGFERASNHLEKTYPSDPENAVKREPQ